LDASGNATFATSTLSAGSRSITATYGGDSTFGGSASTPLAYAVAMAGTSTSVSSNTSSSAYGQSVTFTATVSPSAATGTVQFFDGATSLGTATLSGGRASVSTSTLSVGNHSITATYGGDANDTGSTSSTLTQTVNPASAANFSLSATPASRTVVQGASTTYTATV